MRNATYLQLYANFEMQMQMNEMNMQILQLFALI